MPRRRNRSSRRRRRRRQRQSRSRTSTAGLSFSVSQVEHLLRESHYARHLSSNAPVFLTAVIEYMTKKVLEQAGREAHNHGQRRITPELLDMAFHNNSTFEGFFRDTIISQVAPPQL